MVRHESRASDGNDAAPHTLHDLNATTKIPASKTECSHAGQCPSLNKSRIGPPTQSASTLLPSTAGCHRANDRDVPVQCQCYIKTSLTTSDIAMESSLRSPKSSMTQSLRCDSSTTTTAEIAIDNDPPRCITGRSRLSSSSCSSSLAFSCSSLSSSVLKYNAPSLSSSERRSHRFHFFPSPSAAIKTSRLVRKLSSNASRRRTPSFLTPYCSAFLTSIILFLPLQVVTLGKARYNTQMQYPNDSLPFRVETGACNHTKKCITSLTNEPLNYKGRFVLESAGNVYGGRTYERNEIVSRSERLIHIQPSHLRPRKQKIVYGIVWSHF